MKEMRVHGPGYQVNDMDGRGVCRVAETPIVVCRLPPWPVVCFWLCLIFMPQLCHALMSTSASAHSRSEFTNVGYNTEVRCSHLSFYESMIMTQVTSKALHVDGIKAQDGIKDNVLPQNIKRYD